MDEETRGHLALTQKELISAAQALIEEYGWTLDDVLNDVREVELAGRRAAELAAWASR